MTNGKIFIAVLLLVAFVVGIVFWRVRFSPVPMKNSTPSISQQNQNSQKSDTTPSATASNAPVVESGADFASPLPQAAERVTKKPFGIFITPTNSPVSPEKFRGYHTGADFEIFPAEANADVSLSAVCSGKLLFKKYATGYGGVAVEVCTLNGSPITVVYGHLKLASVTKKVGDSLAAGDTLGILGANKSAETDGERKHLHLGIHKGAGINILGYVQTKDALSGWIDPCLYVCGK